MQEAAGTAGARVNSDVDSLVRAAQRGDQDAFEQLVRAYDQSVLRLAMNLLRSAEDARDVYQEAFLRVYRNLHSFRFDCSFHTWLYRIVTNICLDQLRRRKVRKEEPAVVETRRCGRHCAVNPSCSISAPRSVRTPTTLSIWR